MKYDFQLKQFSETERNPTKTAIAGSDGDIDWKTLKEYVEQLKAKFRQLNIPSGHPVIIYGHKEFLFPMSILACIHVGITYIPIDKIYPLDRIKKIITQTGAQILINCSDNDTLNAEFHAVINKKLEVQINSVLNFTDKIYFVENDILQYIMFTSGSTGEPKGVQITYNAIVAFIEWANKDFNFSQSDVFMNQAPFTFDVSLFDVLNAFMQGGTLVLTSTEIFQNQDVFIKRITDYKCTIWTSTPSFVFLFLRHHYFNEKNTPTLKTFVFIGEELPSRTTSILKTNFKTARVVNAYGPTEATIITTWIEITQYIIKKHSSLPIGYAMPGSELMIDKVNADSKEGELIISGDHVSVGYFKNEELNSQKFFTHNGKRAFKSGDIAYVEDGMFFCKGRNDDQIKMHGFRIELSEISNVLCKNELILDAITIPLKRNNEVKKIISFVILKTDIEQEKLKELLFSFLSISLPDYMIPGDIILLKEFPYNASHKIDKAKLASDYIASQTI
jgi:D-alanine--poly(phosphoribitol) ligase subunit 1